MDPNKKRSPPAFDGHYTEAGVGQWHSDQLGIEGALQPETAIFTNPKYPWLSCTPDELFLADQALRAIPGNVALNEIKSSRDDGIWGATGTLIERWTDQAGEVVPPYYALQAYAQMMVLGAPYCDITVLISWFGFKFKTFRLMADQDVFAHIDEVCSEWYKKHITEEIPPEVDGTKDCRAWLNFQWSAEDKEALDATPVQAVMIRDSARLKVIADEAKAVASAAKKKYDSSLNPLLASVKDTFRIDMPNGGGYATFGSTKKGRTVRLAKVTLDGEKS